MSIDTCPDPAPTASCGDDMLLLPTTVVPDVCARRRRLFNAPRIVRPSIDMVRIAACSQDVYDLGGLLPISYVAYALDVVSRRKSMRSFRTIPLVLTGHSPGPPQTISYRGCVWAAHERS